MGRRKTSRVTAKARFLLLVTLTFFGLCTIARSEESLRILYYFIGGDLESLGGAASADIEEILQAEPSSGVRVFIMAGGAYRWRIPEAAECGTTIFEVQNHELVPFVRNQEGRIGTGEALDDFIHRCTADGIPWDLVFWGHGMPGMGGIGTDQTSQDGDSLTLTEIRGVLMNNVHRPRIIGLDACAMGKLETAWTLSDCAELLIADTLDEPIRGWQHNLYISNADGQMSNDLNAMRAAAVSYRERSTGEISAVILNMAGIRDRIAGPLQKLVHIAPIPEKDILVSELLHQCADPDLSLQWEEALEGQDLLIPSINQLTEDDYRDMAGLGDVLRNWQR